MTQDSEPEFRTRDMALAAFLCCEGHVFLRIERSRKGRLFDFIFDCDDRLNEDVQEYGMGQAFVEPRTFQQKIAWLRSQVYERDGRGRRDGSGS